MPVFARPVSPRDAIAVVVRSWCAYPTRRTANVALKRGVQRDIVDEGLSRVDQSDTTVRVFAGDARADQLLECRGVGVQGARDREEYVRKGRGEAYGKFKVIVGRSDRIEVFEPATPEGSETETGRTVNLLYQDSPC